jgi:hypothetical protein
MMEGKITNPTQKKGFDYWLAQQNISTWLAAPPGTPQPIVDVYRKAYEELANNAEFMGLSKKIAEDFRIQPAVDVASSVKVLDSTTQEALDSISDMMRRQGVGPER